MSTLSPYSGILGDGSAGAHFPTFLRRAGFDQVVIYGRAERPVYLWIEDGKAEILDAGDMRGRTTWETDDMLKEKHGNDVRTASIGPAGENLVRMASTIVDKHASAARGSGAVFGSKNLKAVAVRGTMKVPLADEEAFSELAREDLEFFLRDPFQSRVVRYYGTHIGVVRWYPGYRYFERYLEPGDVPRSLLPREWKKYEEGRFSCFGCPVACKNTYRVPGGRHAGEVNSGMEFEAIHCLGILCGITDPEAIMNMSNMADKYGMDVIALGNTIAYIKELYDRGILTGETTGGLDLSWENAEGQMDLIEKVVRREGFGNLVAEGLYNIARRLGGRAMDYCYHVKGLSRGVHPPGILSLAHATATRGADHLRGRTWAYGENDGELLERWVEEGLVPDVNKDPVSTLTLCERATTISDAIGRCKGAVTSWVAAVPLVWKYPIFGGVARYLKAARGEDYTERDVERAAERIYIVERSFNVTRGVSSAHDTIPQRPEVRDT
ncbi:MAG: aldehyde ferredoxin oxidoreductase, partial [Thermoplasmata archaeon]|nr:aldehyde ferredoxin oxidoreductase [Thermoplasmata archaeon]